MLPKYELLWAISFGGMTLKDRSMHLNPKSLDQHL